MKTTRGFVIFSSLVSLPEQVLRGNRAVHGGMRGWLLLWLITTGNNHSNESGHIVIMVTKTHRSWLVITALVVAIGFFNYWSPLHTSMRHGVI